MTEVGHVVVVGCGRVGSGLARRVVEAGGTTTVIDKNPSAFRRLEGSGVETIAGIGFDRSVLVAAGIERASALAAVTNGDNSNIVIARVAREAFDIDRVVARIYDPRRAAVYERLGITTIATVQWTIERVVHRVLGHVDDVGWIDPSARLALLERPIPTSWVGHLASELDRPEQCRLVAISRLGQAQFPAPDLVLQDGDVVHLAVTLDHSEAIEAVLAAGPGEGGHR